VIRILFEGQEGRNADWLLSLRGWLVDNLGSGEVGVLVLLSLVEEMVDRDSDGISILVLSFLEEPQLRLALLDGGEVDDDGLVQLEVGAVAAPSMLTLALVSGRGGELNARAEGHLATGSLRKRMKSRRLRSSALAWAPTDQVG